MHRSEQSRSPLPAGDPPRTGVRRAASIALLLVAITIAAMVGGVGTAAAAAPGYRSISATAGGDGYVAVNSSGQVYAFGTVQYRGNPQGFTGEIVGISVTADGAGYAAVSSTGQVYAYGTVVSRGNPQGFTGSITGISVTRDGSGYAVISSAGQVYAYGTVVSRGNPQGFTGSMVGISVTGDGAGYIAMSSVGQAYAYGTVVSRGNPQGFSGSMVGISVTADGAGYIAVSSAGQTYAYGTVVSRGNPQGFTNGIVGIATTANGAGYAALSGLGQVYAYGSLQYRGNADPNAGTSQALGTTVVSIAQAEKGNSQHNHEGTTANCNFYTGDLKVSTAPLCSSGSSGSTGWRSEAWCADFARWVWRAAGARLTNLNAGAASFASYGTYRSGPGLDGVQVGDAIVFNLQTSAPGDDHVGIVISVGATSVQMISGNFSDSVRQDTVQRNGSVQFGSSVQAGGKILSGYTHPVA